MGRRVVAGVLGGALAALVIVFSLPRTIADKHFTVAEALNPWSPAARVARAEALRQEVMSKTELATSADGAVAELPGGREVPAPTSQENDPPQVGGADGRGAEAIGDRNLGRSPSSEANAGERRATIQEIGRLANLAASHDPLSPEVWRLLSLASDDAEGEERAMRRAVERSRREAFSLYRLLNASVANKDAEVALVYADVLFKTQPSLHAFLTGQLAALALDPVPRGELVRRLTLRPPWRSSFLMTLPRVLRSGTVLSELMQELKASGAPPSDRELSPLLAKLIHQGEAERAYELWLQMLPVERVQRLGALTNPSFEEEGGDAPFEWRLRDAANAVVSIVRRDDKPDQRALKITFLPVRGQFSGVQQTLMLRPGAYRLTGQIRGRLTSRRGVKWRITCVGKGQGSVTSAVLVSREQNWSPFMFEFTSPVGPGCEAQRLELVLEAHSLSETMAEGELLFDDLNLELQ